MPWYKWVGIVGAVWIIVSVLYLAWELRYAMEEPPMLEKGERCDRGQTQGEGVSE